MSEPMGNAVSPDATVSEEVEQTVTDEPTAEEPKAEEVDDDFDLDKIFNLQEQQPGEQGVQPAQPAEQSNNMDTLNQQIAEMLKTRPADALMTVMRIVNEEQLQPVLQKAAKAEADSVLKTIKADKHYKVLAPKFKKFLTEHPNYLKDANQLKFAYEAVKGQNVDAILSGAETTAEKTVEQKLKSGSISGKPGTASGKQKLSFSDAILAANTKSNF